MKGRLVVLISKLLLSKFYDKKYLQGKYFTETCDGWYWLFKAFYDQKILGYNRAVPWPVARNIRITKWQNIYFHTDDIHLFQTYGTYFQCYGDDKIVIGKNSYIAPNVGLITSNHDVSNPALRKEGKDIIIGSDCWIGMNSILLPGVELGDNTIIGAGSVVTKSFKQGKCVVAGNPARIIKEIL